MDQAGTAAIPTAAGIEGAAPRFGLPARGLYAVPTNDDFDDALLVPALPFSGTVDTREATINVDDVPCNGSPDHSVWFRFTPTTSMRVEANTFGSSYDTALTVVTGTRGDLTPIACNDDLYGFLSVDRSSRVRFDAVAGTTYHIEVHGQFSESGDLTLNVLPAPPPLTMSFALTRTTVEPKTGMVTLAGSVTTNRPVSCAGFGELRQKIGNLALRQSFVLSVESEGAGPTPWQLTLRNPDGLYVAGPADLDLGISSNGIQDDALDATAPKRITLKGKR